MKTNTKIESIEEDEFMHLFQCGICFISMVLIACLFFAGFTAKPAHAADLGGYKDDPADTVSQCAGVSWTGFRIGGLVGVGMTGIGSGTGSASGYDGTVHWTDPLNVSGSYQMSTVGQVEIGYDYHFRNSGFVLGIFGNAGYGSGTTQFTYSIDGRAGFALGNALFYGFGGWEKAHVVHSITDLASGANLASMKADPSGFVYGLGVDVALGHGWYGGVRYERVNYGSLTATGSANNVSYVADVSGTDDRGLLTLGYKF